MGCFSWMFANTNNTRRLRIDHRGYVLCPDSTTIYEPCYEGYGEFNCRDVYNLVASWNREYLANHPEYIIPPHDCFGGKISDKPWYKYYADLSLTPNEVIEKIKNDPKAKESLIFAEWRCIGIEIACYNDQNAKLPFPIKIVSRKGLKYNEVPASKNDPNQGF